MTGRLEGKVALITGAARGQGEAEARRFVAEGAKVLLTDVLDAEGEAVRLFAQLEGLLLDPVYTGRAAAGMIDLIRKGFFKRDEIILFWHTGGQPALFAEKYANKI